MKPITAALKAHLAGSEQKTCTCLLTVRSDGTVTGFTDHDQDLVFNLESFLGSLSLYTDPRLVGTASVTYQAQAGYTPTDVASASDMSVDNLETHGVMRAPNIVEADLEAGLWDNALAVHFLVNWSDLTQGALILRVGTLGEVTLERDAFKGALRGLMQQYQRVIGELTAASCRANLGDARCKVVLAPSTWVTLTGYAAKVTGDAAVGSVVAPSVYNGRHFLCTTAGTSGASEPTWNTTVGGTTSDGSVVWTTILARTVHGTITGVNVDGVTLYDTSRTEAGPSGGVAITGISNANPGVVTLADASLNLSALEPLIISGIVGMPRLNVVTLARNASGNTFQLGIDTSNTAIYGTYSSGGTVTPLGNDAGYFDNGLLTWLTGANAGRAMEVKAYAPGQIVLFLPMPYAVAIGDTYTLATGCVKTEPVCFAKFSNVYNMRAEPWSGGTDKLVQVGKQ